MSLFVFALRRLLWTVPLVVLVMLATYALMRGAGGTPFRPPEGYVSVPETYQRILEDYYRLEEPWPVEFAYYVARVFTFEFGPSMIHRNLRVDAIVEQTFPVTLQLVVEAVRSLDRDRACSASAVSRRRPGS
jgi:ABC-type dipeptide/oligopeptide/nickel transport system permease component